MRPTVHDIAEEAGVSLATVDRVLNGRSGVRPATAGRVEAAIERLGYRRDLAAANLAKSRTYRFVFILPEGPNAFMRSLERAIEGARLHAALDRIEIDVVTVPPFDADALADALEAVAGRNPAGIALVATESARVRTAIARLAEASTPVVTLVSDLPNARRGHYVGIDNVAAGRTAGSLLGRFLGNRRGKVAVLAGSMLVRDHVERRMGFDQVLRSGPGHLDLLHTLEGLDDAGTVAKVMGECLDRHSDIVGIYSLGAGNRGLIEALRSRDLAGKICVVAHELTDHAREALLDGTFDAVIAQDAGHEIRSATRVMKALADGVGIVAGQERIRIDIFLRDNLPPD